MIKRGMMLGLALVLLPAGNAQAEDREPTAIVEIGGAGEWSLSGGTSFGPAAAVEFTPINDWLEIEAGTAPMFGGGRTEWDTDVLFKKPWTLSKTVEFMFGVGPAWIHTTDAGKTADAVAGEVALDFMIWPWPERKFGWFVEPSYSYSFASGHEQSLGVSIGLLIAIP